VETTVFAPFNVSANKAIVSGPISKPICPSGTSPVCSSVGTSFENSAAVIESTGNTNLSPAFSINSFANSTLSATNLPTSQQVAVPALNC